MKFTDVNVEGSITSSSKIACETATEKGFTTPDGIRAAAQLEVSTASVKGIVNTLNLMQEPGAIEVPLSVIGLGDSFGSQLGLHAGFDRYAKIVGSYRCGGIIGVTNPHTAINLSSASRSGDLVTITFSSAHGWPVGANGQVTVAGITGHTGPNPNATVVVNVTTSTQMTYVLSGAAGTYNGASATGTQLGAATFQDYTKSPDGLVYYLKPGGKLACAHLYTGVQGPATHIYYTLFPGTGTAQLQWSDNGGAWTNVGSAIDVSAISGVLVGKVALPVNQFASPNIRSQIVASAGGSDNVSGWIGQGLDGPGITSITFSANGQDIDESANINETIWKAMIAGYKESGGAQIITSMFADSAFSTGKNITVWPLGTENYGAAGPIQQLFDWARTANSTMDWVIYSPHRVDDSRYEPVSTDIDNIWTAVGVGSNTNARIEYTLTKQRDWAMRNGQAWANVYEMFPTYAVGVANGYYSDDIHFNSKGNNAKIATIFRSTNLQHIVDVSSGGSKRLGHVMLSEVKRRSGDTTSQIIATNMSGAQATVLAKEFRAGVETKPEAEGCTFRTVSSNIAAIGSYGSGGESDMLRFELGKIYPVTTDTGALGKIGSRFNATYTNSVFSGYREITAAHTIVAGDHTINITSGTPFNITIPVAFTTGEGGKGRELIFCNNSGADVTLITVLDAQGAPGPYLQKIDAATTLVVPAGSKVRIKSCGALNSNNYKNWITF